MRLIMDVILSNGHFMVTRRKKKSAKSDKSFLQDVLKAKNVDKIIFFKRIDL